MPAEYANENEVLAVLERKYPAGEWAFLPQVPDGTGSHQTRWADAIAMSLWPSRGLEVHGFEVKVSRTDWLKELRQQGKADPIARYCDRWWIVAGSRQIVEAEELPKGWGLMLPHGDTFRPVVKAALRKDVAPLDRSFFAGLMRGATKAFARRHRHDEIRRSARREGYDQGLEQGRRESKRALNDYEQLQRALSEFEAASGLSIHAYNGKRLGEAVHAIQTGGLSAMRRHAKLVFDNTRKLLCTAHHLLEITKPEDE